MRRSWLNKSRLWSFKWVNWLQRLGTCKKRKISIYHGAKSKRAMQSGRASKWKEKKYESKKLTLKMTQKIKKEFKKRS
ncbi:hypothetical protein ACS0TY_010357 [Phlomoides rotata]